MAAIDELKSVYTFADLEDNKFSNCSVTCR